MLAWILALIVVVFVIILIAFIKIKDIKRK